MNRHVNEHAQYLQSASLGGGRVNYEMITRVGKFLLNYGNLVLYHNRFTIYNLLIIYTVKN